MSTEKGASASGERPAEHRATTGGQAARLPSAAPGPLDTKRLLLPSPRPGDVALLQRTIGNQAVQRALRTQIRPATRSRIDGVRVQRQVLADIRLKATGHIEDVILGGRTPSPFAGTMGAHGTAWVAHIDQVRRLLIGADVTTAASRLIAAAQHEKASPLKNLIGDVGAAQQAAITTAEGVVDTDIATLQGYVGGRAQPAQLLQGIRKLVDSLLTFVNYLPSATIQGGDPSGHGEGSARANLNLFEYLKAKPATNTSEIRGDKFAALVKREAATGFAPNGELKNSLTRQLWTLFAAETPGVFAGSATTSPLEIWKLMLKNFLETIRQAYPHAYEYSGMDTPLSQELGLNFALQDAGVADGDIPIAGIRAAIAGGLDAVKAAPSADAVGPSDVAGATAGFQSSVFMDHTGVITDIQMIGRTRSPFSSTMGRHSTAWIAHVDALKEELVGLQLDAALTRLLGSAGQLMNDPSLGLINLVDEKQLYWLGGWYTELETHIAQVRADLQGADASRKTTQAKGRHLEKLILEYMSFMNLLPFSTINHGSIPDGRNEGRHRQFLKKYEENGVQVFATGVLDKDVLLEHLLGLWDGEPLEDFRPEKDVDVGDPQVKAQIPLGHALYPKMVKRTRKEVQASQRRRQQLTFQRFLDTIATAYTNSTRDSGIAALRAQDVQPTLERIASKSATGQAVKRKAGAKTGGDTKRRRMVEDMEWTGS